MNLNNLSEHELKELIANAHAELMLRNTSDTAPHWYEAICASLKKRGITCPHMHVMRKRNEWYNFKKHTEQAEALASEFLGNTKGNPRVLAQVARKICVESLIEYVNQWTTPDHTIMMRQLEKITAALQRSYPNYRRCGKLPLVLAATLQGVSR
jgi:hypothetical protein